MEKPYIILQASHAHELEREVNEHIKQGFKVKGGVTAKEDFLFQAMLYPDQSTGKGNHSDFEANRPDHTI
ncbi:hypothetical protein [Flaviaesturariibacter terrae]